MNKKILLVYIVFLCTTTLTLVAQGGQGNRDKAACIENFKEQKRAYIIKEVGLTDNEVSEFFPLYNEMWEKRVAITHKMRAEISSIQNSENQISDDEYKRVADLVQSTPQKEFAIENAYYAKFKKILSPEKLYKLQIAELRFGKAIIRRGPNNRRVPEDRK